MKQLVHIMHQREGNTRSQKETEAVPVQWMGCFGWNGETHQATEDVKSSLLQLRVDTEYSVIEPE